jgi:hypothetical protein
MFNVGGFARTKVICVAFIKGYFTGVKEWFDDNENY